MGGGQVTNEKVFKSMPIRLLTFRENEFTHQPKQREFLKKIC